jgi:hypothetical protein
MQTQRMNSWTHKKILKSQEARGMEERAAAKEKLTLTRKTTMR